MFVSSRRDFNVFVVKTRPLGTPSISARSSKTGLKTNIRSAWRVLRAWCCFCSCSGMETYRWTRALALLLPLLLSATYAQAQAEGMERVRSDSRYLRLVIASGIERSPTFRRIVDRLEQSDLIVEVQ